MRLVGWTQVQKCLVGWSNLELEKVGASCEGVERVEFFNVAYAKDTSGEIEFTQSFASSRDVCALWLGVDGDSTQSSFAVHINRILMYE